MNSVELVPAPVLEVLPAPATLPEETSLPKAHHEAYRQKLAGRSMQEIADSYSVDRTTVYRWCKRVESEAQEQLANEPVFNIIVRETARLTDLVLQR